MEKFVKVAKREGKPHEDVPLNDDGALALSILLKYFPRAVGLKYFSDTDVSHEIDMIDEKFYPPLGLWGDITYYCSFTDQNDSTSESLCIEDIPMNVDEDDKNSLLHVVHITIKDTKPKTKKRTVRPKGKYKKRRPHMCDICFKKFRNLDYMERHRLIHSGEKPYGCSHCDERFARPDILRIHVNKIHSMNRRPKRVLTPRSPTSRKREKRRTDDLYEWGEIKKRKYMRRHSKRKHDQLSDDSNEETSEEGKFYECHNCAIQFPRKSLLRQHSCISDQQTQFTCEECRQTFSKLSKLRLHLYKCHADEKSKNTIVLKPESAKTTPKPKSKCKYAIVDAKQEISDVESSDDDISFWDYTNDQSTAFVLKCDCRPHFNIVSYIEQKIPPEILTKFKYCKENNIPWTGFLGYSSLYKFWSRIVNDNPILCQDHTEIVHMVEEDPNDEDKYTNMPDYLITEEEESSEAATENSNFLKGLDDLIKFN